MPGSTLIDGHARKSLVAETALSVPGSTGLGTFEVNLYSRFAGLISCVGSVTMRYAMGVNSGTYQVSSSFIANSGGSVFDVLNFGRWAEFTITAANSQSLNAALIYGEPIR